MQPIVLSLQQQDVVNLSGNVLVTACPGSGKTRVLTAKVLAGVEKLSTRWQKVAALTYTSRAADEITNRLREHGYDGSQLWTGTIHAFALEWILRPYGCYHNSLRNGFAVADEFYIYRIIDGLRPKYKKRPFDDISTGLNREGNLLATDTSERDLVREYREILANDGLIDFDLILFYSHQILHEKPMVARTLGKIFKLVCLDEYQDTQDLQYSVIAAIVKASENSTSVFIVGDLNQAIYTSLGSRAMSAQELRDDFALSQLHEAELSGNYRSTQRVVDFCHNFGNQQTMICALADHAGDPGIITFSNQQTDVCNLPTEISSIIRYHLISGVKASEICVLAPTWEFAISTGRQLSSLMPDVNLDAPGLSPIKFQNDSAWFKLARLFLTEPSPSRYQSRIRWASDLICTLERELGSQLAEQFRSPRSVLRMCNAISSSESIGLNFLDSVITQFTDRIGLSVYSHPTFFASRKDFFDGAQSRIDKNQDIPADLNSMRRMFRHRSGVVINSCHGVKGEEFEVVICFGILKGRIPHWNRIFNPSVDDSLDAQRLLYVICSRAKKYLHLFSESGRCLRDGKPYKTTEHLTNLPFEYDDLASII